MKRPLCRLCSREGAPHHKEAGGNYYRCLRCGFVFLFPAPAPEELERIYESESGATFHHAAEIREAHEKILESRLRLRVVAPALRSAPKPAALEIGCGAGYLLLQLRRRGWTVAGTEVSKDYARFARQRLGIEVGPEPPGGSFGAVLLFNVLSHLPDPERELGRCRDLLEPGGVLILETGNAAEVAPERVGLFGAPEHLGHFSEQNLRDLLEHLGFRDIRARRFNVEWQRRALRGLEALRSRGALRPHEGGSPSRATAPPWLKRLAAHAFLGLRFGLGRFLADRHHFCTLFLWAFRERG